MSSDRAWVEKYTLAKHAFEKDTPRVSSVDQFTVLGLKEMLRSLRVWPPNLLLQGCRRRWVELGLSPRLLPAWAGEHNGDLSRVCLCPLGSSIPSPLGQLFNYHLLWKVVQGQR